MVAHHHRSGGRPRPSRHLGHALRLAWLGTGLLAFVPARGDGLDTLTGDSPFASPGGGGASGDAAGLEFRGVLDVGGDTMVGLFDRGTGECFWVSTGTSSPAHDLVVHSYDATRQRLELTYNGRALTLSLAVSHIVDQNAAPVDAGPGGGNNDENVLTTLESTPPELIPAIEHQREVREYQVQDEAEQIAAGLRLLAGR